MNYVYALLAIGALLLVLYLVRRAQHRRRLLERSIIRRHPLSAKDPSQATNSRSQRAEMRSTSHATTVMDHMSRVPGSEPPASRTRSETPTAPKGWSKPSGDKNSH